MFLVFFIFFLVVPIKVAFCSVCMYANIWAIYEIILNLIVSAILGTRFPYFSLPFGVTFPAGLGRYELPRNTLPETNIAMENPQF